MPFFRYVFALRPNVLFTNEAPESEKIQSNVDIQIKWEIVWHYTYIPNKAPPK